MRIIIAGLRPSDVRRLAEQLAGYGHEPEAVFTLGDSLKILPYTPLVVIVCGWRDDVHQVVSRAVDAGCRVVLFAAYGQGIDPVVALKAGASHVVSPSLNPVGELVFLLERGTEAASPPTDGRFEIGECRWDALRRQLIDPRGEVTCKLTPSEAVLLECLCVALLIEKQPRLVLHDLMKRAHVDGLTKRAVSKHVSEVRRKLYDLCETDVLIGDLGHGISLNSGIVRLMRWPDREGGRRL